MPADTIYDFVKHRDELFTRVFERVSKAKTRFVVVYGGSASSKSYSVHQNALFQLTENGAGDTLVIRKYAADLRQSCYKLFMHLIDKYEMRRHFRCTYSGDNKRITFKPNGRSLVFRGIDDPEKLKSIVNFNMVLVEEATQLQFEDFIELNRRVRGFEHIQLFLILNPISENHWIKMQLCNEDGPYANETTALSFNYKDNVNEQGISFLTEADKKEVERHKALGENHYRVYALGEWGVDSTENKFCYAFSREQVVPTVLDEERVVWATFDFNVNPLTCIVAQVFHEDVTVRAIECIKLEDSDIWKMCARLNDSYPDARWMVTGDATGKNRSAVSRDNINYYQIISQELDVRPQNIKVPRGNPRIEDNRLIVNKIHKTWNIEIDPQRCQPLIYDLTYVEVDEVGDIVKTRTSSKKYADFLDAWRYLLNVVDVGRV